MRLKIKKGASTLEEGGQKFKYPPELYHIRMVAMDLIKTLSTAEKKRIRLMVEKEFERYRMFKSAGMIEGNSNYYPKKKLEEIQAYCMRIEKAVAKLPEIEKQLITERYLNIEGDYITDQQVYTHILKPPISERTYGKYRERAVEKLVFLLDLEY